MTIGNRIAELRKSKGFTQEYIAEQLGVSRQAVSKWEQDLSWPDTKNLIALSALLGVSIEYIATGYKTSQSGNKVPQSDDRLIVRQINRKISTGNIQLVIGVILLVLTIILGIYTFIPGLILVILGCVNLSSASHMSDDRREAQKHKENSFHGECE